MAYNITGKSHVDGVFSEENTKNWLEKNKSTDDSSRIAWLRNISSINKKGGTKEKDDLRINYNDGTSIGLSNKHRSSITSTFDYINTTKNIKEINGINPEIFLNDLKKEQKLLPIEQVQANLSSLRKAVNNMSLTYLEQLNDENLRNFLLVTMEKIKKQIVIIEDNYNKNRTAFYGHDHPIFSFLNDPERYKFFLKSKQKRSKSKTVYVLDTVTKEEYNTAIRIRLVLNNGVRAAFGLNNENKDKNQDSWFCLKLQQEEQDKLFKKLEESGKIEKYPFEEQK